MTLQELMAMMQGQRAQPLPVRSDYGLTGASISPQRSPYERTLAPGDKRSSGDLQNMLAEVIMAAGSAAVPGVQGQSVARRAPGMRAVSMTHPGDLSIKQLRNDLKGGSLEWAPIPSPRQWMLRFPDGTALKGFQSADEATAWMAKNKIEF